MKWHGYMDSYHLANMDILERGYWFFYEGDSLFIFEEIGSKGNSKSKANVEDNFGILSSKSPFTNDNGLSVM